MMLIKYDGDYTRTIFGYLEKNVMKSTNFCSQLYLVMVYDLVFLSNESHES